VTLQDSLPRRPSAQPQRNSERRLIQSQWTLEEFSGALRRLQNPDGGFPYSPGKKSSLEPTAMAVLAMHRLANRADSDARLKAQQYLLSCQETSGRWPISTDDSSPAWETPLVLLALSSAPALESACRTGMNAFLKVVAEPANPQGILLNPRWKGWNWYPPTPGWVEPTSLGLLAVSRLRHLADGSLVAERLEDGRQFLLDRMAPDGGWNYGNSYVLGHAVSSFLSPTAMALIALHPTDGRTDRMHRAAQRLESGLATTTSGLALSWGSLALAAYNLPFQPLLPRLYDAWRRHRFLENSAVISLAMLAASATPENHPFLGSGKRT